MNRWSKNGVLDRIFERLQQERILRLRIEAASLDSTVVFAFIIVALNSVSML
jgi:hypothetical protein